MSTNLSDAKTCVGPANRQRPCGYCGSPPGERCRHPADEHAAFEKWAVEYHGSRTLSDPDAGSMWSAWKARAALATKEQS
jgi:hypothetical protein